MVKLNFMCINQNKICEKEFSIFIWVPTLSIEKYVFMFELKFLILKLKNKVFMKQNAQRISEFKMSKICLKFMSHLYITYFNTV